HVYGRTWLQDFWFNKPPFPGPAPTVQGETVALVSRDKQWVVSPTLLVDKPIRLFNNREYSCMHCNADSSVKPGETRRILQRIYFLRGSLDDLVARYQADAKQMREAKDQQSKNVSMQ